MVGIFCLPFELKIENAEQNSFELKKGILNIFSE